MNAKEKMAMVFASIYTEANQHGRDVALGHTPTPMVVQEVDGFGPNARVIRRYPPVMGGVCGFAWVHVRPATCRFAKWLKANKYASYDSYQRAMSIWVSAFGQSYERKMRYAEAFAEVVARRLQEIGETGRVSSGGRLD